MRQSFDCKKFLTQWKVSAFIFSIEYNLLTTNDTIWIAPDNWIVQDIIPGQYVDLDSLPFIEIDPLSIHGLETKLTDDIVSAEDEEFIPTEITLKQNYPNPFNPSTSIQYTISNQQFVSLKVYDILGNEVATLVNSEKPAGVYEVEWNAANVPSGVYFYQLKTGSFVQTKKMLLLK